jgi:hypothetical protein
MVLNNTMIAQTKKVYRDVSIHTRVKVQFGPETPKYKSLALTLLVY